MDYLVVILALAVLLLVVVVGFVVSGVRSRRTVPRPPAPGAATGVDEDIRPPGEAPSGDTTDVDAGAGADTLEPDTAVLPEGDRLPALEVPEPVEGRLVRLRARLARSQSGMGRVLLTLLSRDRLDEDAWEEFEDTLITADIGVAPATELVERLRTRVRVDGVATPEQAQQVLHEELVSLVGPDTDRSLRTVRKDGRPAVLLVVGVNGTGKTTTVGKLARVLVAEDKDVLLGAADTFRAAAADQLTTWGERVGVPTVRGDEGADPASVAFEAVRSGIEQEVDVVLVDTAGRLQTKVGLMDELGKVKRVIEKQTAVDEVLLVLDATTGQNGMTQAKVFSEAVDVTGIVLTKLDGTAKGGIVVSVQDTLGVPVKLVGLGEGPDDLAPFEPEAFVSGLLASDGAGENA